MAWILTGTCGWGGVAGLGPSAATSRETVSGLNPTGVQELLSVELASEP